MYKDAVVSGTSTYIFVVLLLPLVVHSRIEGLHTTMTFSASTDYYLDPVVCGGAFHGLFFPLLVVSKHIWTKLKSVGRNDVNFTKFTFFPFSQKPQ